MWFFPRGQSTPINATSADKQLNPNDWPLPVANFVPNEKGSFKETFRSQRFVVGTSFCGEAIEAVWDTWTGWYVESRLSMADWRVVVV